MHLSILSHIRQCSKYTVCGIILIDALQSCSLIWTGKMTDHLSESLLCYFVMVICHMYSCKTVQQCWDRLHSAFVHTQVYGIYTHKQSIVSLGVQKSFNIIV